ncbi:hypothetical protein CPB85DRAFT_1235201 [Mucidula mucida]|nr:hypothetical protein CPB85DRAFT_1235201 [Mucidula mucida]
MTTTKEPKAQAASLPTAALAYKFVTFENLMATDSILPGVVASQFSSWRPNLDIGWYYLGQGAEMKYGRSPTGIIVHALEPDALRDVVGWERIWEAPGVVPGAYYALWRGVPPNRDYVVVGGIFSNNKDWAEPDSEQTRGIMAIRRDLLVMDGTFEIWNDRDAGLIPPSLLQQALVWKTTGQTGASPSALILVNSYSAPPRDISFSLNRSKTLLIESATPQYQNLLPCSYC